MKVTALEPILPTNLSMGFYSPQNPIDGLKEARITKKRSDEKGKNIITYSNELVFTGADADFIKSYLVTHISAFENFILVHMDDECCGNTYTFMMRGDQLDWCYNECDITVGLKEYSPDNEIFKCLDSTVPWIKEGHPFTTQQHPRIMFCKEIRPDWLQVVVLILGVLFDIILIVLTPVVLIISVIISILCTLITILTFGIVQCPPEIQDGIFDDYIYWFGELNKSIVGCGYKNPSPLVREYIQNACNKCGASFHSHIFTEPASDYYNSVYFFTPTTAGLGISDSTTYWMQENTPLKSTIQVLDDFIPVFNGDYYIRGGVLEFERKDYFVNQAPWLDLTSLDPKRVVKVCFQWNGDPKFAYVVVGHSEDGFDPIGQEARLPRFRDIVEWNDPPSPLQSGALEREFGFGASRYREDGVQGDTDILGSFEWVAFYSANIIASRKYMIMNIGLTMIPKLLIWDGVSSYQEALVKRDWNVPGFTTTAGTHPYNYPYWVREDLPGYPAPAYPSCLNNAIYPGNLYNRFHYIDNPRTNNNRNIMVEAEIQATCVEINANDINGTVFVPEYNQNMKCDEIEIDYDNMRMTIKGTI